MPPPQGDPDGPLRALVFDSWFDQYRGVVILVHVKDGRLEPRMKVKLMAVGRRSTRSSSSASSRPSRCRSTSLSAGEVGFVIAGIKKVSDVAIGDTLTDARSPAPEPLPGFKEIKPMVFAGLFPVDADQYAELRDALEKLRLNDSSFFYEPETLDGARLRLPLRLPGPPAHGDRDRAAGARVLARAPDHGAVGALPRAEDERRDDRDRLAGAAARSRRHRVDRGADHHRHHPDRRTSTWAPS